MKENDWTTSICEILQATDLGKNIYVETFRKLPYAFEISSFTGSWNISDYDQTVFETDLLIYEKKMKK